MGDRRRRGVVWPVALMAAITLGWVPMAEASDAVASVDPPPTTAPAEPETTEPDTTAPDTTEAMNSDPDDDTDVTVATVVSLLAFALVLVVAGWWMVSRRDSDDEPHPRQAGADEPLPGQDLV